MASEEAVDWRIGLNTIDRFTYMLEGKYASDVTFLVGEGDEQEVISCHRFPLIAGSSVFENLLENKFNEQITVPEVEPIGFKAMLKYLYGGDLHVQADNVMALMHTASVYKIPYITETCGDFLKDKITTDNVCIILQTSIKYKEVDLTKKCLQFIQSNASNALNSKAFVDISSEALGKISDINTIKYLSEFDVYTACIKWSEAECQRRAIEANDANKREALGDVLFQIRFPAMIQSEFVKVSHKSEVLTAIERAIIYDHIVLHGSGCTACDCTLSFKKEARYQNEEVTVRRYNFVKDQNFFGTGNICAVDFMCNRPCLVTGASFYGGDEACQSNVSLKLLDSSSQTLTSVIDVVVNTDGSPKPYRINFSNPENIKETERYSLVLAINGRQCVYSVYSGSGGNESVVCDNLRVSFFDSSHGMFQNEPMAHNGQSSHGQLPELHFKI